MSSNRPNMRTGKPSRQGRRSGLSLNGRNIRQNADGTENFLDYFDESSEAEPSELHSTFPSCYKLNFTGVTLGYDSSDLSRLHSTMDASGRSNCRSFQATSIVEEGHEQHMENPVSEKPSATRRRSKSRAPPAHNGSKSTLRRSSSKCSDAQTEPVNNSSDSQRLRSMNEAGIPFEERDTDSGVPEEQLIRSPSLRNSNPKSESVRRKHKGMNEARSPVEERDTDSDVPEEQLIRSPSLRNSNPKSESVRRKHKGMNEARSPVEERDTDSDVPEVKLHRRPSLRNSDRDLPEGHHIFESDNQQHNINDYKIQDFEVKNSSLQRPGRNSLPRDQLNNSKKSPRIVLEEQYPDHDMPEGQLLVQSNTNSNLHDNKIQALEATNSSLQRPGRNSLPKDQLNNRKKSPRMVLEDSFEEEYPDHDLHERRLVQNSASSNLNSSKSSREKKKRGSSYDRHDELCDVDDNEAFLKANESNLKRRTPLRRTSESMNQLDFQQNSPKLVHRDFKEIDVCGNVNLSISRREQSKSLHPSKKRHNSSFERYENQRTIDDFEARNIQANSSNLIRSSPYRTSVSRNLVDSSQMHKRVQKKFEEYDSDDMTETPLFKSNMSSSLDRPSNHRASVSRNQVGSSKKFTKKVENDFEEYNADIDMNETPHVRGNLSSNLARPSSRRTSVSRKQLGKSQKFDERVQNDLEEHDSVDEMSLFKGNISSNLSRSSPHRTSVSRNQVFSSKKFTKDNQNNFDEHGADIDMNETDFFKGTTGSNLSRSSHKTSLLRNQGGNSLEFTKNIQNDFEEHGADIDMNETSLGRGNASSSLTRPSDHRTSVSRNQVDNSQKFAKRVQNNFEEHGEDIDMSETPLGRGNTSSNFTRPSLHRTSVSRKQADHSQKFIKRVPNNFEEHCEDIDINETPLGRGNASSSLTRPSPHRTSVSRKQVDNSQQFVKNVRNDFEEHGADIDMNETPLGRGNASSSLTRPSPHRTSVSRNQVDNSQKFAKRVQNNFKEHSENIDMNETPLGRGNTSSSLTRPSPHRTSVSRNQVDNSQKFDKEHGEDIDMNETPLGRGNASSSLTRPSSHRTSVSRNQVDNSHKFAKRVQNNFEEHGEDIYMNETPFGRGNASSSLTRPSPHRTSVSRDQVDNSQKFDKRVQNNFEEHGEDIDMNETPVGRGNTSSSLTRPSPHRTSVSRDQVDNSQKFAKRVQNNFEEHGEDIDMNETPVGRGNTSSSLTRPSPHRTSVSRDQVDNSQKFDKRVQNNFEEHGEDIDMNETPLGRGNTSSSLTRPSPHRTSVSRNQVGHSQKFAKRVQNNFEEHGEDIDMNETPFGRGNASSSLTRPSPHRTSVSRDQVDHSQKFAKRVQNNFEEHGADVDMNETPRFRGSTSSNLARSSPHRTLGRGNVSSSLNTSKSGRERSESIGRHTSAQSPSDVLQNCEDHERLETNNKYLKREMHLRAGESKNQVDNQQANFSEDADQGGFPEHYTDDVLHLVSGSNSNPLGSQGEQNGYAHNDYRHFSSERYDEIGETNDEQAAHANNSNSKRLTSRRASESRIVIESSRKPPQVNCGVQDSDDNSSDAPLVVIDDRTSKSRNSVENLQNRSASKGSKEPITFKELNAKRILPEKRVNPPSFERVEEDSDSENQTLKKQTGKTSRRLNFDGSNSGRKNASMQRSSRRSRGVHLTSPSPSVDSEDIEVSANHDGSSLEPASFKRKRNTSPRISEDGNQGRRQRKPTGWKMDCRLVGSSKQKNPKKVGQRNKLSDSTEVYSPSQIVSPQPLRRDLPKRDRIRPLDYWKGEYRSYRYTREGEMFLIETNLVQDEEAEKKKLKTKKLKTSEDVVPFPQMQLMDPATGESQDLVIPFRNLVWESGTGVGGDTYKLARAEISEEYGAGFVQLDRGGIKGVQYSPSTNIRFLVLQGSAEFLIEGQPVIVKQYDCVLILQGLSYSIRNVHNRPTLLYFNSLPVSAVTGL